jgi:hypothetical protein
VPAHSGGQPRQIDFALPIFTPGAQAGRVGGEAARGLPPRLHQEAGDREPVAGDRALAGVQGALLGRRGLQARGRGERRRGPEGRVPGALAPGAGRDRPRSGRLRDLEALAQAAHPDRLPLRLRRGGRHRLLRQGELPGGVAQGAQGPRHSRGASLDPLRPGEADDIGEDEGGAREGEAPGEGGREAPQAGGQEGGGQAPQARRAQVEDRQDVRGEPEDPEQEARGVGRAGPRAPRAEPFSGAVPRASGWTS